jgi:PAS domain S-box-containing protein
MAVGIHVLYVDDEPSLLEIGKMFLERDGLFSVDTVASAPEALQIIAGKRYDAIISDYQMPEMDGIEFLKHIRASGNTVPFIIFTGRGREEIVIQALNKGADFYLQKGGEPESQFTELAHKIQMAVTQRRAEASVRDHEHREADIINFLPDATLAIDTNGIVIAWNRAMEMMTGVKSSEILGKDNYEYAIPFYHERRPILINLVLKDDPITAGKYPAITRDGKTLYSEITIPHFNNGKGAAIWFTASPLYDTQGTIVGAIESVREITERKRIEEEITFKNIILSTQQETSLDGILIVDESGKILNYNRRFTDIWRIPEDLIASRIDEPVLQHVAEQLADPEAFLSRAKYLYDHKGEKSFDELLLKDGRILERFSAPMLGEKREYFGRVWFFHDITKRKLVEKEIQESEEKYRTVFENTGAATVVLEDNDIISLANNEFAQLSGFSKDDIEGKKSWTEFVISEDLERMLTQHRLRRQNHEKALTHYEFRFVTRSGSIRTIYLSIDVIPGTMKSIASLLDITERKLAEEDLQKSEERYRNIVEEQTEFISRFLPDGTHVFVNEAYCRYFGFNRNEILGYRFRPRIPVEDQKRMRQFFESLTPDHPVDSIEHRINMPDGNIRWQRWSDHAIFDDDGNVLEYQSVGRDITDLKEAEHELLQKNKEINAAFQELTSAEEELKNNYDMLSQKELALRESEAKYRLLTEVTDDVIYMIDVQGIITHISPQISRYGYKPEDILSRNFTEFIAEEDVPNVVTDFERTISTRQPTVTTLRLRDTTGNLDWMEDNRAPVFDTSGTVIAVSGILRNVTVRKKAEEALKESEKKFRALVELSIDGIFIIDFSGNLLFVNRAAGLIVDVSDYEALIGKRNVMEFVAPESQVDVLRDIRQVAQGIEAYLVHYKLITETKREIWVECIGKKIQFGDSSAMLVSTRDITRQKQAETELRAANEQIIATEEELRQQINELVLSEQRTRESEEQFRSIVETSPDMIWETDLQGKFRYISPMVQTIMGYTPEEVIGKSIIDLIPEEGKAAAMQELMRMISSKGAFSPIEIPTRHRNGSNIILEIRPARLTGTDGKLKGLRGVTVDITERKRAEDALHRANRQLSLLTGITRHDILNKIAVILGFLKITEIKFNDPALVDYLKKIESATTAIRSQIEFTRVYQDLGTHEPQWIDLNEVMPLSPVPAIITLNADVQGMMIFADPMLEKVFFNLLDNSIRHGERVTDIRVSSHQSGKDLVVLWEDNGIGIVKNEKERIFERGFGKNTGLGMFLVREILSLTDITIKETGEPSKGARFEMMVPKGGYRFPDIK